jgi:hypothetical protein
MVSSSGSPEETFRFSSKEDYEKTLIDLLKMTYERMKTPKRQKIEREYEELMDEYLRFCSGG